MTVRATQTGIISQPLDRGNQQQANSYEMFSGKMVIKVTSLGEALSASGQAEVERNNKKSPFKRFLNTILKVMNVFRMKISQSFTMMKKALSFSKSPKLFTVPIASTETLSNETKRPLSDKAFTSDDTDAIEEDGHTLEPLREFNEAIRPLSESAVTTDDKDAIEEDSSQDDGYTFEPLSEFVDLVKRVNSESDDDGHTFEPLWDGLELAKKMGASLFGRFQAFNQSQV